MGPPTWRIHLSSAYLAYRHIVIAGNARRSQEVASVPCAMLSNTVIDFSICIALSDLPIPNYQKQHSSAAKGVYYPLSHPPIV